MFWLQLVCLFEIRNQFPNASTKSRGAKGLRKNGNSFANTPAFGSSASIEPCPDMRKILQLGHRFRTSMTNWMPVKAWHCHIANEEGRRFTDNSLEHLQRICEERNVVPIVGEHCR
jgi:hypothetical protein